MISTQTIFLVDREFNVLAVIDWESVVAVPDAALYRFPFLMGARSPIPGLVDAHPAVVKRQQLGRRFAKVVEAVALEEEEADAHKSSTYGFTTTGFFSKEALAFRSLVYMKHKQDWANEAWLQGLQPVALLLHCIILAGTVHLGVSGHDAAPHRQIYTYTLARHRSLRNPPPPHTLMLVTPHHNAGASVQ